MFQLTIVTIKKGLQIEKKSKVIFTVSIAVSNLKAAINIINEVRFGFASSSEFKRMSSKCGLQVVADIHYVGVSAQNLIMSF